MKRCPESVLFTSHTWATASDARGRVTPSSEKSADRQSQPNEGDIDVMAKRRRTDPYLTAGSWDLSYAEPGRDTRGRRIGVGGSSKSVKRPTWVSGHGYRKKAKALKDKHNKSGRGTQAVIRWVNNKTKTGARIYYQKRPDTKLTKKVKTSRKRSAAAKKGWEKRRRRK